MSLANDRRVRLLREGATVEGAVAYWMSRDQRVQDNWALLFAQQLALERKVPLVIVFCLVHGYLGATLRQYDFMLRGLEEVAAECQSLAIPFVVVIGDPKEEIPRFAARAGISVLVTDFNPLRPNRFWKSSVLDRLTIPVFEVDSHNIVPCWVTSSKLEFAARTIRPKIHRQLPEFLTDFPRVRKHPHSSADYRSSLNWDEVRNSLKIDESVAPVATIAAGAKAGLQRMRQFINEKLERYAQDRNDPTRKGQSGLSPYLHFGQVSAQRVAWEVQTCGAAHDSGAVFLEELIVRRELSDNFCLHNEQYDSFAGFPEWARKTLDTHRGDVRHYIYAFDQFEQATTHDALWNAAQWEMIETGKMHGYMRMYWAKKILEWSLTPEEALDTAIRLNDRYELDGRDPNGYAGIAWSIGGLHDRPWFEREIFGRIRYMSAAGCARKFDVKKIHSNRRELSSGAETVKVHSLHYEQTLPQPLREVFAFFERPENLARITPPSLGFVILTPQPIPMGVGTLIDYTIKVSGFRLHWRTLITTYEPPYRFVDVQLKGPYAFWHHTHAFAQTDGGTLLSDDVCYALPYGPLGELAHILWVRRDVEKIFRYRSQMIADLFS